MRTTWKVVSRQSLQLALLLSVFALSPASHCQVISPEVSPGATLFNINFCAHLNPTLGAVKTGLAATGQTATDFWNIYSRDDGTGQYVVDGALANLKLADGTVTSAGLMVSNAPGCWNNGSPDAMYNTYLYPLGGGNVTAVVTNLPAGQYDFYVYSHNSSFQIMVGATDYGTKLVYDWPLTTSLVWKEGVQYALFRSVSVSAGQSVTLTARPSRGDPALLAGMQITTAAAPVGTAPEITTQPQSQSARVGWNATFTVAATGSGTLSYQWRKGTSDLAGATDSALVLNNVQATSAGTYCVLVSNSAGSVLSSNAVLSLVQAAPATLINIDYGSGTGPSPDSGPAAVGQGTGDFWNFYTRDDSYGRWKTVGTLTNMLAANGVASGVGMTISNAPGCWSITAPDVMYYSYVYPLGGGNMTVMVTNLPAGQYDFYIYNHDSSYQLSVGATDYGTETSYDWPVSLPLVWQQGLQYGLFRSVSVAAGQAVKLTVLPGRGGLPLISGMQISTAASVAGPAPRITTQPQSQSVRPGWNATFNVVATSSEPMTYQWRLEGKDLPSATSPTLVVGNVQSINTGNYSVVVSNKFGPTVSSDASLSLVQSAPSTLINIDYGSGNAPSSESGPAAVGQGPSDFWNFYTRDDGSGGWRTVGLLTNLLAANGVASGANMIISNAPGCWGIAAPDAMYASYVYPLGGGDVTVGIWGLPPGQYDFYLYSHDSSYQLSVGTTDYGTRTSYDWPVSLPLVWHEGRQYGLFRTVDIAAGQAAMIRVLPGAGELPLLSGIQISTATVVTGTPPRIITQPQGQSAAIGSDASFTVSAGGTGTLGYQWKFGTTAIDGATSSALVLSNVQLASAGNYSVVVTNDFGSITSSSAALVVTGVPPSIATQPQSQTVGIGASALLSVTTRGTEPFGYQWRLNDTDLSGETGSSLAVVSVQPTNAGYYSVWVTNAYGTATSAHAALSITQTVAKALINIDFGSGPTNGSSAETGPAAVGQGPTDFWNFYTRDNGSGGWRTVGALDNLKLANGAASGVSMTISNGPGCWASSASDRMYYSYVYSLNRGDLTVTLTGLPAGLYDFYAYNQDGNYQMKVGATDYGTRTTWDYPILNPTVWQEGRQYALFRSLNIGAGQAATLTARLHNEPYAIISGMQVVLVDQAPVALCSDVTVAAGPDCTASASINNGSYDPEDDPITLAQSPPGPYPLGTNLVTLTVTDSRGAYSSCSARVIVTDQTAPVVTCPADKVVEFVDETGAVAAYSVTAGDACSAVDLVVAPTSGSLFPIGITTVNAQATDAAGNQASCSFTVTVLGTEAVRANVLAELTALRAGGNFSQAYAQQLDAAIQHLGGTLNATLWVSQTRLKPKGGNAVMREDMLAVGILADILGSKDCPIDPAVLQGLIDRVVKGDRLLAVLSIQEAAKAGLNPRKVAEDLDMVAKGDDEAKQGHYANAIEHYRNAWRHALQLRLQVSRNADGTTRLQFIGNTSQSYGVDVSTDLVHWVPVGNCTADSEGDVDFTDANSANQSRRFYRAVEK